MEVISPATPPARRLQCLERSASSGTILVNFQSAPVDCTDQSQGISGSVSSGDITNAELGVTLKRIEGLRTDDDEEERPSDYAYDKAVEALKELAQELRMRFPRASASVGPNRGLRITWSFGPGEVRLVIGGSAANKSYIYREYGPEHGVEHIVDGRHIAQSLRWVLREV
jgi:hypothetical protein